MKFKKLKLNNFRQYIGENCLEFAGYNGGTNVTLIFGGNGFGKTGIFRAIMFCLYGDTYLEQDGLSEAEQKKGLTLVNERLLEESPMEKIKASVELEFEHDNNFYVLKREIFASKDNKDSKIRQEPGKVSLQITAVNNTQPTINGDNEVKQAIEKILSKGIRDFFLFDGEKMERLTRHSRQSQDEIKKGIRILLQLDALKIAKDSLGKFVKEALDTKIKLHATGELLGVCEHLKDCNEEIEKIELELNTLEKEKEKMENLEREIEKKLNEEEETRKKQEKRDLIKEEIKDIEEKQKENKKELGQLLEISGIYLAQPAIAEIYSELDSSIAKGEIPSGLREEFIDKLLNEYRCICGTELHDHSDARKKLLEYKNERNLNAISDTALAVFKLVLELKSDIKNIDTNFESATIKYSKLEQDYEDNSNKLDTLNKELKGMKQVENYGEQLEKIKKDKENNKLKTYKFESDLSDRKEEKEKLEDREKELTANEGKLKIFRKQKELVNSAKELFERIYNEYSIKVRENLSESATHIFEKLADPDTLKSLAKIEISDKFQLDVLSNSGVGMLSQISSGQRQVVSLAYICALLEVASNLEMPLLMDTPFGRLSGAPRDACLKELPKIVPQWILLGTDTEFREEEASALRHSGCWGKIYEIIPKGDRHSIIEEGNISNWIPVRRSR